MFSFCKEEYKPFYIKEHNKKCNLKEIKQILIKLKI